MGSSTNKSDGMRRILIAEDDEVSRNLAVAQLQRLGHSDITAAEDGERAWELLQKEAGKSGRPFDFIVLDWKLPKLSGLALFNRLRRVAQYRSVPVLVVSGYVDRNDFRLLQEFPCTGLLEKPYALQALQTRIDDLSAEAQWYEQHSDLMDQLLSAVEGDGGRASQLVAQVLKDAPNPLPLALIAAKQLTKRRYLKEAQQVLKGILKVDPASVVAQTEMGKVLHLLGRHKQGLEVLLQAQRASPQNLQRLCLMGEVELNLKDPDSARGYFEKALRIDDEDRVARSGMTVAGNMASLLEAPDVTQMPQTFGSMLNTLGITFVRNGQFTQGIEQYMAALAFIHSNDEAGRVAFNLGLGYLRWGKPAEALPWFKKSESLIPAGFNKSASYVRQLMVRMKPSADGAPASPVSQASSLNDIAVPADAEYEVTHQKATDSPIPETAEPGPLSRDNDDNLIHLDHKRDQDDDDEKLGDVDKFFDTVAL